MSCRGAVLARLAKEGEDHDDSSTPRRFMGREEPATRLVPPSIHYRYASRPARAHAIVVRTCSSFHDNKRWVVERTSSCQNAHKKLPWCTERRERVILGDPLRGDHHRKASHPKSVDSLPLGGPTFTQTVTCWREGELPGSWSHDATRQSALTQRGGETDPQCVVTLYHSRPKAVRLRGISFP
jgi:hypothetical protein